jgi:hypothetical protein
MKVYIVNTGWHYEGETTLGVFETLKKAFKFAKESKFTGNYTNISETVLGSGELKVVGTL